MGPPRDDVWCFLVARRSVARAALHLGISSLSREALDTLAESVLAYGERCAAAIAVTSEAARRPAANVLDALAAIPLVTSPAVRSVHWNGAAVTATGGSGGEGAGVTPGDDPTTAAGAPSVAASTAAHGPDPAHDLTWKGLAAFMFGPNWEDQPSDDDENEADGDVVDHKNRRQNYPRRRSNPDGGKVGPSASSAMQTASDGPDGGPMIGGGVGTVGRGGERCGGWCAPYPDELPPFPVRTTAGPSSRPTHATDDNDKDDIPNDALFALSASKWGSAVAPSPPAEPATAANASGDKRDRDPDAMDEDDVAHGGEDDSVGLHRTKRVKGIGGPASTAPAASGDERNELLVPRFLPPFPQPRDVTRAVVEGAGAGSLGHVATAPSHATGVEDDPMLRVRSSLVALPPPPIAGTSATPFAFVPPQSGQYWGSGWDDAANNGDGPRTGPELRRLAVPWGRSAADAAASTTAGVPSAAGGSTPGAGSSSSAAVAAASAAVGAAAAAAAPIVPLGRASGSRVSRILEGSMDGS